MWDSEVAAVSSLRRAALAAVLVLGTALPAIADTPSAYLTIGAGANFLKDNNEEGDGVAADFDYHTGPIVLGAVGYRWGNGLRAEFEPAYRRNSLKSVDGCFTCGDDGSISMWAGMINVAYDFDFGWPVKPYIGTGAGVARGKHNDIGPINGVKGNDSDWAIGYQGFVGLIYPLTDVLELFGEYRYFATQGLDLGIKTPLGKIKNENEYRTHDAIVGLRWTFWKPEAPPRPHILDREWTTAARTPQTYRLDLSTRVQPRQRLAGNRRSKWRPHGLGRLDRPRVSDVERTHGRHHRNLVAFGFESRRFRKRRTSICGKRRPSTT